MQARFFAFLVIAVAQLGGQSNAIADFSFFVEAKSDLSNAGRNTIRAPYPPGTTKLPVEFALPGGVGRVLTFNDVTGTVNAGPGWADNGADGGTIGPNNTAGTNILGYNGISGIYANRFLFLTGVFLNDSIPVDGTEPDRLDFAAIGTDFLTLSPRLNQSFFIGDGQTNSGTAHQFLAPDDATRLFLGFLDSGSFGWPQGGGLPFAYHDNTGALSGRFSVVAVPEPSSLLFVTMVLPAVIFTRGRQKRPKRTDCRL